MVKKWTQVGDRIKNLRVKSGGLNSANDEQPWTQKVWLISNEQIFISIILSRLL